MSSVSRLDLSEFASVANIIIEKIEEKRQNSIEKAIQLIRLTIYRYEQPPNQCTTTNFKADVTGKVNMKQKQYACDSTVLGSLQKSAAAKRLWPGPKRPYTGLTWSEVEAKAQCLNIVSLCDHAEFPLKTSDLYIYTKVQADQLLIMASRNILMPVFG